MRRLSERPRLPQADELSAVPLFPLPRITFFPHTELPLHFFEPRYVAMVEHCLAVGPRLITVIQLAPGWEDDYEGQPGLTAVGTVGRIAAHGRRDQGTFDVVLEGLSRVSIDELPLASGGFRLGRLTSLEERGEADVPARDLRAVHACAASLAARIRQTHPDFELGVTPEMCPGQQLDILADRLIAENEARRAILETTDLTVRTGLMLELVGELLARFPSSHPRPS
jgi:Lon protease-like protein